jgi:pimeloyl-ACP methyl ester carboxylesterase
MSFVLELQKPGLSLAILALVMSGGAMIAQTQPRSEGFAEVNGTRLYYEQMGKGRTIVLIHGGLVDSRLWDDQFREFAKRYRVIRYDLRGFGKSDSPSAQFSPIVDLHALLGFLKVEHATVIGVSLGGMIATDFALEYPRMVDALVLVGSALRGDKRPQDKLMSAIYQAAKHDGADTYVEKMMTTPLLAGVKDKPRVRARMRQMMIDSYKGLVSLDPRLVKYPEAVTIGRLESVRARTLVIVGSKDHPDLLAIAEILQSKIPGAQKVLMSGASHHPNIEQPKNFNRIVVKFLRKS